MPFRHRKFSLTFFSVLSLSLTACGPSPTSNTPPVNPETSSTPTPGPSASAALPVPSAPGTPNSTPTPMASTAPAAGGSTSTVTLPNGSRLVIGLPNRFLSSKGQTVQLSARLLDASGKELPLSSIKLLFSSSRPEDFSVSDTGLVTALKDSGFSTLTVQVEGTNVSATQLISVDTFVGGSSGGGGGSSPSASPTPSPTPSTQVNASVNFEGLGVGEFQVNTYTTSFQNNAAVAMDADGDFVVAWETYGQDSSYQGVYGQRYNAAGVPQGSEFRVNTYTTGAQSNPAIAMNAEGDFVITWESLNQDGDSSGIYGQRYNAAGVPQGSEFRVNTYTTNSQNSAAIAMDAGGDFVVTWESTSGQDGSNVGIYAQRYNATGEAQGSEFRVNTYTTGAQLSPEVAMNADGDFVVTWETDGQDSSYQDVYGQRYNAAGAVQGSEFRVNTFTSNDQNNPAIAMDADGDFVISWQSYSQDGSQYGIYGQRYNAAGIPQGSEFSINTYTTNTQGNPAIAMDADGDFVVTWQSSGQDGNGYGTYAQRYNAAGVSQGSEFRVNTYTSGGQSNAAIAMDADGDFVVTWQSNGQDGDYYGIYSKQYQANGMAK